MLGEGRPEVRVDGPGRIKIPDVQLARRGLDGDNDVRSQMRVDRDPMPLQPAGAGPFRPGQQSQDASIADFHAGRVGGRHDAKADANNEMMRSVPIRPGTARHGTGAQQDEDESERPAGCPVPPCNATLDASGASAGQGRSCVYPERHGEIVGSLIQGWLQRSGRLHGSGDRGMVDRNRGAPAANNGHRNADAQGNSCCAGRSN